MPTITGTLESIVVTEDKCCLSIDTGTTSTFAILWSTFSAVPTAAQRLTQNQWLNLSRDALINVKTIVVTTDSGSSLATAVRINLA